jgi:hypothetical protein
MPYHIGEHGSNGCSGYPVIDESGKVVGCHPKRAQAEDHMGALYANVPEAQKADDNALLSYPGVGIKRPSQGMATTSGGKSKDTTSGNIKSKYGKKPKNIRTGRSGNANDNAAGSVVSGGSGGSMGTKFDNMTFWDGTAFEKKDYSTRARQRMADSGEAMPDGSFPIGNAKDLHNAIQSIGRASNPAKVKAHIKSRARALGMEDAIPEGW